MTSTQTSWYGAQIPLSMASEIARAKKPAAQPSPRDAFGHDMALGDLGGVYFFVGRGCPDTPYTHRYDG
ncbi:hypothetical protein [Streptomyces sp. NPDC093598]|uniref:hypothetical protein n=1 Tax=Streptomyces sp. NPDC093598 TaxID=3366046 RepID=UPI0038244640